MDDFGGTLDSSETGKVDFCFLWLFVPEACFSSSVFIITHLHILCTCPWIDGWVVDQIISHLPLPSRECTYSWECCTCHVTLTIFVTAQLYLMWYWHVLRGLFQCLPSLCPLFFSLLVCVMCWICRIYFCLAPAFLTPAALLARPPWGSEAPPHHLTFPVYPHTRWLLSSKCSLMCFSLWHHSDPGSPHFLPWRQFNCTCSSCIHSSVCIYPHPCLSDSRGSWHWQAQLLMRTKVYSSKLKERMVFLLPCRHSKYSKHWLLKSLV